MYVVKGPGDTALLSHRAAERMGLVEYHLDLTMSTPLPITARHRDTASDCRPSRRVQGCVLGFRKVERGQGEIARGARRKRRRAETEKNPHLKRAGDKT